MHRHPLTHFCLALAASVLSSGKLPAQQLIDNEQVNQFSSVKFGFVSRVLSAQEAPNPQHMDMGARYFVSRLTLVPLQSDPKKMYEVIREFEDMVTVIVNNAKANRAVVGQFAPKLIERFKEIFALDFDANRVAQVNAAVLLPQLAKLRQEEVGDFLTSLIADDKKHDAIRVHAVKGLREYFPAKAFDKFSPNDKATLQKKDRDVQRVDALLKFIERPMSKTVSSQEEVDALRFLRREAVITLAMARVPAVSARGKLEGTGAVGLIKALAKKVQPEPTVQERVEAGIGICHFGKWAEEYDPKIGIYLFGETLVDFVSEYKKDFPVVEAKNKAKAPTVMPWRIQSKRLEIALTDLVNNTNGTPSAAAAQALANTARPLLKTIYNSERVDREQDLRNAVSKLRPAGKILFKNEKGTMLELEWETAPVEATN